LSPIDATDFFYVGLDDALAVPDSEIRLFGKPEALVNRRMGVVIATAESCEDAKEKAIKAANLVSIHSR